MPIYQYKCDGCGHAFEKNHPMSDPPVKTCPECNQEKVRKIFATGGIVGSIKSGSPPSPPPACSSGMCGSGMCGL
ncbi:FmdB family zinc ribbon protein [Magnetococcales bacterium HHB-1]